MKYKVISLFAPFLSACAGGSSETPTVVEPLLLAEATPPAEIELIGIPHGYLRLIPFSSTAIRFNVTPIANGIDHFDSYQSEFGDEQYVVFGETDSGAGMVFVSPIDIQVARLTDTTLQTQGTSTYTGSYASILIDNSNIVQDHIFGDAEITVDFDSELTNGSISSRRSTSGANAEDILFEASQLLDGGTQGITSGGTLGDGFTTADDGIFIMLIVGDEGQEATGLVAIEHNYSTGATVYNEFGGFVLD